MRAAGGEEESMGKGVMGDATHLGAGCLAGGAGRRAGVQGESNRTQEVCAPWQCLQTRIGALSLPWQPKRWSAAKQLPNPCYLQTTFAILNPVCTMPWSIHCPSVPAACVLLCMSCHNALLGTKRRPL